MTAFDVDALRRQFPSLLEADDGHPIAYFDGPGGTQVPQSVIDAVADYYRHSNANSGGAFLTSRRSDAIAAAHPTPSPPGRTSPGRTCWAPGAPTRSRSAPT